MEVGFPTFFPESFSALRHLFFTDDDNNYRGHGKMKPAWVNGWLVASLMLLLSDVPLPQIGLAGTSTAFTEQQWEPVQKKQQLIRERFDRLLEQARSQRELMMAWHKKTRLQQVKQNSLSASKRGKAQVAVAASR
jgi:hypothetical protein